MIRWFKAKAINYVLQLVRDEITEYSIDVSEANRTGENVDDILEHLRLLHEVQYYLYQ